MISRSETTIERTGSAAATQPAARELAARRAAREIPVAQAVDEEQYQVARLGQAAGRKRAQRRVAGRAPARRRERSYQVDEGSAAVLGEHSPMLAEQPRRQCITRGLVSRAS